MIGVAKILLFALGVSATLVQRQTIARVISDIQTTRSDANALTTSINNYDGTIGGVAPIQQRTNVLIADLRQSNTDLSSTPTLSASDCAVLVNYVNGLGTSINSAVNSLTNIKSRLPGAQTSIQTIKDSYTALLNTVTAKCRNGPTPTRPIIIPTLPRPDPGQFA